MTSESQLTLPDDYVGCSLGYFWCSKLRDAKVSAQDAAKLSGSQTGESEVRRIKIFAPADRSNKNFLRNIVQNMHVLKFLKARAVKKHFLILGNRFQWLYDGAPTCIAKGGATLDCPSRDALVCAGGGGTKIGSAVKQAEFLAVAMLAQDRIHPACPGFSICKFEFYLGPDVRCWCSTSMLKFLRMFDL